MITDLEAVLWNNQNIAFAGYNQAIAELQYQIAHLEAQLGDLETQNGKLKSKLYQTQAHVQGLTAQLVAVGNQLKSKDPNNFLFHDSGQVWRGGMHKGKPMGRLGVEYLMAFDKEMIGKGVRPDMVHEWYI